MAFAWFRQSWACGWKNWWAGGSRVLILQFLFMTVIINFKVVLWWGCSFQLLVWRCKCEQAEWEQILFQSKCLGVRVCKNCLMNSESLPILWQTQIKPTGSWSRELNNFLFSQVLRIFLSCKCFWLSRCSHPLRAPGQAMHVQGLSWGCTRVAWKQDRASRTFKDEVRFP